MPFDDEPEAEPEGRGELFELVAGIAIVLMVIPGVIWWMTKLIEIGRITWEVFQ